MERLPTRKMNRHPQSLRFAPQLQTAAPDGSHTLLLENVAISAEYNRLELQGRILMQEDGVPPELTQAQGTDCLGLPFGAAIWGLDAAAGSRFYFSFIYHDFYALSDFSVSYRLRGGQSGGFRVNLPLGWG